LKPLLEGPPAALYPGELHKIFVHHDKAPSHTARNTERYADEVKKRLGVTIISNSDIPVKAPDASPMDFHGFGYLKQILYSPNESTPDGACKVLEDNWNSVTPETVKKVFDSLERRLRLISRT